MIDLRRLNWTFVVVALVCHVGAALALPRLVSCHWQTLVCAIVFYNLGGLGITAANHRLYSHRAFKASDAVRFFLILYSAIANQGTAFHWAGARDHRVHHKFTDTDADPHNAKRGFFFSHVGWLLVKKHPDVVAAGKQVVVDDLLQDWVIRLQMRCNPYGQLAMCFVLPVLVCRLGWQESYLNGLFIPGFLRYVLLLHSTWCINSVAHALGYTPYDASLSATENQWVSFAILGEGWHNWHHAFPYDYAASEFGIASQWNPTKLFIDACAYVGHVTDRKRALKTWEARKHGGTAQLLAKVTPPCHAAA
ncbi:Aste57867_8879 [Aphanomyces stellatus]|uniref:Aste57867_8879 protein n=1 Tax=Aphanomyces stellatus TaxID=120398 RepID=A0A485KLC5_9STRA|nr:hypothetical protein As57867_008844 [Aphanomyces stellatus]VFT85765.1 Aste57867_8879 [Aphanomyces stellatus]